MNQEVATANSPGSTPFFAVVGGFHSQPKLFQTCPVESISINAFGNPSTTTSFVVNAGTSTTLNATVTDSAGMNLVGIPLTWTSTNPISVTASGATSAVFGSVGTASASAVGASAVIASCTPPSCNGGISPSLPIYPASAFSFTVRSSTVTTSPAGYATSTGCSAAPTTCVPTIVPITRSSSTTPFAVGTPVSLPSAPNSILFDGHGTAAYLGVDSSAFGTQGLMTFTGSAASRDTNVSGKVLAVSPDSTLSVLSNTSDSPNQVFVCGNCTSTTNTAATFQINGATAAAFSPDSLKLDIVAGNNLYVYSKTDPLLQPTPPLTAPANDVTFFPQGAFAYVAGGAPSAVTVWRNCDNTLVDTVSTSAIPQMIRALPDAATIAVLDPPYLQLIHVTPNGPLTGCTPSVSNAVSGTFNLGQGNFIPTQFILSPDGSAAYILGEIPSPNPPSRFPFVIAFNFATQSPSFISLAGGATPISASVSPASDFLFVGADDGPVHIIDTATHTDLQQITFPFPGNALCYGLGNPVTQSPVPCLPDLVAVRP